MVAQRDSDRRRDGSYEKRLTVRLGQSGTIFATLLFAALIVRATDRVAVATSVESQAGTL